MHELVAAPPGQHCTYAGISAAAELREGKRGEEAPYADEARVLSNSWVARSAFLVDCKTTRGAGFQ
jgi:hypothetical protein